MNLLGLWCGWPAGVGLGLAVEAECALAAVENEVLEALDDSQCEVLYNLLLQAANGSDVRCPLD
jgi:hypothetical protein